MRSHPAASPAARLQEQLNPLSAVFAAVGAYSTRDQAVARVLAVLFGIGLLVFIPLEWRWDLLPTREYIATHGGALQQVLMAAYGNFVGSTLVCFIPFITKSIFARLAGAFVIAALFAFGMEVFDWRTNWDGAWQLEFFANWGPPVFTQTPGMWVLYWGGFLVWLVICSSGFQFAVAICLTCYVIAVWNSFASVFARIGALAASGVAAYALIARIVE